MSYIGSHSSFSMIELPPRRYLVLGTLGMIVLLVAVFFYLSTTVYQSQVIVKPSGDPIGINPLEDRVDFGDVPQGSAVSKTLEFNNEGTVPNKVRIIVMGGISDLVKVPEKSFTLQPGEQKSVEFELVMPPSATPEEEFTGRVIVVRLPLRPF